MIRRLRAWLRGRRLDSGTTTYWYAGQPISAAEYRDLTRVGR